MKTVDVNFALKNESGATIASIYETLVVSDIGDGFVSVLPEDKKSTKKKPGIGFCPENAAFDWVAKNYITEEIFAVGDKVDSKDARFVSLFQASGPYVVSEILEVSSLTDEVAREKLSGYESALIKNGKDPQDIYGHSQLIKMKTSEVFEVKGKFGGLWFSGKDFTKAISL